jgi:hypothetical protein
VKGNEILWELPKPQCDVKVSVSIKVRHWLYFANGADDGGGLETMVALTNSLENGDFAMVGEGNGVYFGLLSEITDSGWYDSGNFVLTKEFQAPKDAIIRVALGHFLRL